MTVIGFGSVNYEMWALAGKGTGYYAYIENLTKARKVLVNGFGGTLPTLANDVKLQVEFNPAQVKAYRLIGYEDGVMIRALDPYKEDAVELSSGHTLTALYEIIPVNVGEPEGSNELMTVKLGYKKPGENESKLVAHPLVDNQVALENTSDNFRWAASVAAFGMLLRESEYVSGYSYDKVIELAEGARGKDKEGYRVDFINLAKSFGSIASRH